MPGRGSQTFQKRQKEQQRKERQQEKMAKRLAAKNAPPSTESDEELGVNGEPLESVTTEGANEERPESDVFGARS